MEEIISKEELEKIKEIKGEVKGAVLKSDVSFILERAGKDGIKKIERKTEELGFLFKYNKIESLKFYPIGLRVVSLLVIKNIFGFSDEEIKNMGRQVPKDSFVLRLSTILLGFSKEPKKLYANAPMVWRRFVTVGEFTVPEFSEGDGGRVIDRIEHFDIHPILCVYLSGILEHFHEIARKAKEATVREIKCSFKGDEFHDFLIEW
jgi:hypothetical protein